MEKVDEPKEVVESQEVPGSSGTRLGRGGAQPTKLPAQEEVGGEKRRVVLVKKVDDWDLQEGFKCGNVRIGCLSGIKARAEHQGTSSTQGNMARISINWVDRVDRQEVGGMSGGTKAIQK